MEKTREPILLPAILFSVYLLLFPIDSALGELIGTISVNNYIAVVSLALTLVFAMKRIIFKFDNFTIIYLIYVLYQFLIIINGGYFFTNRNVIFLFYNFMTIIFIHVEWTEREKKFFKYMILLSIIITCYIISTRINFNSSGRMYLVLGRNIDQNYLSSNLIFGTALIANSVFKAKRKLLKVFYVALILWIIVCIFFLGSRGSLLGNTVVILSVVWLNRKSFNAASVIIMLVSFVLAIIAGILFMPDWIAERFNISNMISSGGAGRTIVWRDYLYFYSKESLSKILFGYGRGFIYDTSSFVSGKCTHNVFLKSLIEGGIIGFILHTIMFVEMIITTMKAKSHDMIPIIAGYIVCGMFLDLDDYRILPLMIIIIMIYKDQAFCLEHLDPRKYRQ